MKDRKAYLKQWYQDDKERIYKGRKQYYQEHKEEISKQKKQYRIDNKEKITEYMKQYCMDNKEERNVYSKQYYIDNPEKSKKVRKQYQQSEAGRAITQRANHKRRFLGFIPLNKPFLNSEAHHISENFIIYIPKVLHQSIGHSLWTWRNMDKINKLAIGYL